MEYYSMYGGVYVVIAIYGGVGGNGGQVEIGGR